MSDIMILSFLIRGRQSDFGHALLAGMLMFLPFVCQLAHQWPDRTGMPQELYNLVLSLSSSVSNPSAIQRLHCTADQYQEKAPNCRNIRKVQLSFSQPTSAFSCNIMTTNDQ